MRNSNNFIFGNKHPIEDLGGGIKRQLLGFNQQVLMAKVWFDDSAIGYVHKHYHAQVAYIESGEFEIEIAGEKKVMKAGDSFYIEPNIEHGAVCLKAGVLIDVFSPCREDFLPES
ncbi:cupin domain-containing protein [Glaciecola sp. MH2013]|uniref:cupin domain-containing protein n=1 Tax=Glaciecola sp. MH2013 TaxID=2785524 RepID=UPI00189D89C2|nr:cupin domain-containing protein [Glaciecola sp. MH2013]MBF7073612.1 cupin domain-containing protein [Glaciecola sp. MH2013]